MKKAHHLDAKRRAVRRRHQEAEHRRRRRAWNAATRERDIWFSESGAISAAVFATLAGNTR